MQHVSLADLDVSRIGLGAMGMSAFYTGAGSDDAESIRTIHRALELGITLIDTAEVYGPYTNEELVGRAITGRRDEVVLATKFGLISHRQDGASALDSSPESMRVALEGSLRRLGTDHIDLYYQHRVDPGTPIEETIGALGELVSEGKIRHIGLSEAGPGHDPARACGASDHRRAERVLAVDARSRGRGAADAAGARHRPRALLPARPRLPDRAAALASTSSRRRISAPPTRALPATTCPRTCASSTRSRRSPPKPVRRRPRWRWRGCWPRAMTSPRSRGRSTSHASRRTRPPTRSSSPRSSWRG